jgi:hypothetical protein
MDETSISMDSPGSTTYNKKGSKRVLVTTSGSEKTSISAAFCSSADVTKLPPLVIIPHILRLDQKKVILFIDSAPCHKRQDVINKFKNCGV